MLFKNIIFHEKTPKKTREKKCNANQLSKFISILKIFSRENMEYGPPEIICTISGSAMGVLRRGKSVSCRRATTALVLYLFLFQELSNIAHIDAPYSC